MAFIKCAIRFLGSFLDEQNNLYSRSYNRYKYMFEIYPKQIYDGSTDIYCFCYIFHLFQKFQSQMIFSPKIYSYFGQDLLLYAFKTLSYKI